jgi:hypothetical protein
MKKPALVVVFQILAALWFAAAVLCAIRGELIHAIGAAFACFVMLGFAELVGFVAATAHHAARSADALESMNLRELRLDAKARAAEQARLNESIYADADPSAVPEVIAEGDRIRRETRVRAGL